MRYRWLRFPGAPGNAVWRIFSVPSGLLGSIRLEFFQLPDDSGKVGRQFCFKFEVCAADRVNEPECFCVEGLALQMLQGGSDPGVSQSGKAACRAVELVADQ